MSEHLVPGTVLQVDIYNNLRGVQHNDRRKDIVLVPQPTSHPDDPLNWTKYRKWSSISGYVVYTFLVAVMVSSLSPANLMIEAETGIAVADINTGVGLMYLFLGWSNLIWQPLAIDFGRRPVLVVSTLMLTFMVLWSAYASNVGEWWINRILQGVGGAPIETLVELCVADVNFAHERGFHMSLYTWTLFNGAFLGPIAAGFVANRFGWQWIQYICTIIGAVTTIYLFFFMEETMFHRTDTVEAAMAENFIQTVSSDAEVKGANVKEEAPSTSPAASAMVSVDRDIQPKSYMQRLKCWNLRDPQQPKRFWNNLMLSLTLIRFPAIFYSGLLIGSILSWFNVVNGTLPTILGNAPYNFSADMLGVIYVSPVIGVSFGCYFSGWISDKVAVYMARRNNGVYEPEHRLWVGLIPLVLHPVGCILYGVGASHEVHWVGVAFGLGIICATLPMGSAVACNYIIDSYKEVAGNGLVTIILVRNTMGFAFAYAVLPMVTDMGIQNAFILLAFLGAAIWAGCIVMIIWGKKFRKATAATYWKMVEEQGLKAH
ncbi:hypothetical protein B0A52_10081 [Exophiala mesophila]|uniref:Major facilitator superfamily (MFS) profile domain-containing protein n=1 Tax=Exophiala mesophila TaxID=212818 RepID=A0A438MTD2_EXOME|nr:hypothetical protein B0A52_10081 [Exophiala mesophila]